MHGAIQLPNSESGQLRLLIRELWDEVRRGCDQHVHSDANDEVETLSFGRNALSYSKNRSQFPSTMQRLEYPRFIAAAHGNPLPVEHKYSGFAVVFSANFLDELKIDDE